jgi:hypothetical protein
MQGRIQKYASNISKLLNVQSRPSLEHFQVKDGLK